MDDDNVTTPYNTALVAAKNAAINAPENLWSSLRNLANRGATFGRDLVSRNALGFAGYDINQPTKAPPAPSSITPFSNAPIAPTQPADPNRTKNSDGTITYKLPSGGTATVLDRPVAAEKTVTARLPSGGSATILERDPFKSPKSDVMNKAREYNSRLVPGTYPTTPLVNGRPQTPFYETPRPGQTQPSGPYPLSPVARANAARDMAQQHMNNLTGGAPPVAAAPAPATRSAKVGNVLSSRVPVNPYTDPMLRNALRNMGDQNG